MCHPVSRREIVCESCPKGSYKVETGSGCAVCPAGTYRIFHLKFIS